MSSYSIKRHIALAADGISVNIFGIMITGSPSTSSFQVLQEWQIQRLQLLNPILAIPDQDMLSITFFGI